MLIGFIFGTICVISGGFAIRRGDTDSGKLSIIGGLIIAGAPVIVKALFVSFGDREHRHESGIRGAPPVAQGSAADEEQRACRVWDHPGPREDDRLAALARR